MRQRARTALLLTLTACLPWHHAATLPASEVARVYAAVLSEVRPATATHPVVIDTLMPATDVDAEHEQMVVEQLSVSARWYQRFVAAQTRTHGHVSDRMAPDSVWRVVPPSVLDSLRQAARSGAPVAGGASTGRLDAFWSRWNTRFPDSGGYVMLSPITVSEDGTEAMVHVWKACGSVCGLTELRRLRRDANGQWHTVGRVELSIS